MVRKDNNDLEEIDSDEVDIEEDAFISNPLEKMKILSQAIKFCPETISYIRKQKDRI